LFAAFRAQDGRANGNVFILGQIPEKEANIYVKSRVKKKGKLIDV